MELTPAGIRKIFAAKRAKAKLEAEIKAAEQGDAA
jgi:hypothetical protein